MYIDIFAKLDAKKIHAGLWAHLGRLSRKFERKQWYCWVLRITSDCLQNDVYEKKIKISGKLMYILKLDGYKVRGVHLYTTVGT